MKGGNGAFTQHVLSCGVRCSETMTVPSAPAPGANTTESARMPLSEVPEPKKKGKKGRKREEKEEKHTQKKTPKERKKKTRGWPQDKKNPPKNFY